MAVGLAAVVLVWPAIATTFFLDDHLHASMVRGTFPAPRSPFDLYDFVDDAARPTLLARGLLPWWSHPHLTLRFFRPLSSALLWLDHNAFAGHALPMHLHSLAWWGLAAVGARQLYAQTFSWRVVAMATAIFALSPAHALPLAWLANREVLVSLAFGLFALARYQRFRESGGVIRAAATAVLFLLTLGAGGEYGLAFGGYVVAFDLTGGKKRRLAGWATFGIPAAAYLGVRGALHYGTAGSGFYTDPLGTPLTFAEKMPLRALALLSDGWLDFDTSTLLVPWQRIVAGVAIALGLVLVAITVRRTFASLEGSARHTAWWLASGSLLALLPVLAVVPSMRLLGVATIGIAATTSLVLEHAWFDTSRAEARSELGSLVAIGLGFAHLVHGPATLCLEGRHFQKDADDFAMRTRSLDALHRSDLGLVRGMASMYFLPFAMSPHPATWRVLSQTGHVLALRQDAHTLDLVVAEDRALYPAGEANLFRSEDAPLAKGDAVVLPGLRVEILATGRFGPRHARFAFDAPLDDLRWLTDDREGVHAATLPEEGLGAPFDP